MKPHKSKTPESHLKELHVLIADDNPAHERFLKKVCAQVGVSIIDGTFNSMDAVLALNDKLSEVDLFILDIILSSTNRMEAIALARRLRADPRTHSKPILFVTSEATPEEKAAAEAVACGDTPVLTKSSDSRPLASAIRKFASDAWIRASQQNKFLTERF